MTKQEELAWAAGFFDGEGCVGCYAAGSQFYKNKEKKYVKVAVANTDKSLLDRFQRIVGFGKVDGPYIRKNSKWLPRYTYRANGINEGTKLFEMLKPYLGDAKRKDFEEAIASTTAKISASVAELVDAAGSNPVAERHGGSNPP